MPKEGVIIGESKTKLASQLDKEESPFASQDNQNIIVLPGSSDSNYPTEVIPAAPTASEFTMTFTEAQKRLQMLQTYVKEMMIPGLDYGIIPGCPKPSLLKPGAEKLCDIYGLSKLVTITNRIEDWEKGFFSYEVKTTLINKRTGFVEAEGLGSCNSKERKYKSQDAFSIANTILKMAKKRAIFDGVLSATRSSGIFSQDIEELAVEADPSPRPNRALTVQPPLATKQQLRNIFSLVTQKNITPFQAKALMLERYQAEESKRLTAAQADDFLAYLQS